MATELQVFLLVQETEKYRSTRTLDSDSFSYQWDAAIDQVADCSK